MKNLTYKLFFSFEGIGHDDKGQQKICHDLLAMVPELLSPMDTDTPYEGGFGRNFMVLAQLPPLLMMPKKLVFSGCLFPEI